MELCNKAGGAERQRNLARWLEGRSSLNSRSMKRYVELAETSIKWKGWMVGLIIVLISVSAGQITVSSGLGCVWVQYCKEPPDERDVKNGIGT